MPTSFQYVYAIVVVIINIRQGHTATTSSVAFNPSTLDLGTSYASTIINASTAEEHVFVSLIRTIVFDQADHGKHFSH